MSRSEIIAEWCVMSAEQIATTVKTLEAVLDMEEDDIKKLIADGNAIIAKRKAAPSTKRGRPRRKEVIQEK